MTLLLDPKLERSMEQESRKSRIVDLRFDVAWCLRSPEIEALIGILKLRAYELRLVETRFDEWRVVNLLLIETRCQRSPIRVNKSK